MLSRHEYDYGEELVVTLSDGKVFQGIFTGIDDADENISGEDELCIDAHNGISYCLRESRIASIGRVQG